MTNSQLIYHVRVIDPANHAKAAASGASKKSADDWLLIGADGNIKEMGNGKPAYDKDVVAIDGGGAILAPSFTDMRVTMDNIIDGANLGQWSRVAFAGGVGTVVAVPSVKNPLDDMKTVRAFLAMVDSVNTKKLGKDTLKIHCYGAMTKNSEGQQLSEYGLMKKMGVLGFSDGAQSTSDSLVFWRILLYAKNFDGLVVAHPEDMILTRGATASESGHATRLGLPSAPALAEALQLARDIAMVRASGRQHGRPTRYHSGPITTRAGVEIIRQAKKEGLPITADTAPHYFALNEQAIGQYLTHAKLSPPLRSEDDRLAVIEGLLDGTIDAIASDHRPLHDDKKRLPFASAVAGMVGLETMLPLAMTILHHQHGMTLEKLLAVFSHGPRRLLGLMTESDIFMKANNPANLVLIDDQKESTIDSRYFLSASKNTPFDGWVVKGQVLKTWQGGRLVFSKGEERP